MIKKIGFLIVFWIHLLYVSGQVENNSVIKSAYYEQYPKEYLSYVNASNVQTNILIDRSNFPKTLYSINGKDLVSVVDCSEWAKMYNSLLSSSYKPEYFLDWETIKNSVNIVYENQKAYSIGMFFFKVNAISQSAIDNGNFTIGPKNLIENISTPSSFSTFEAFSAACLSHNLIGDKITFHIPQYLYFTNRSDLIIKSIEIDFDNGSGYQTVQFNDFITVSYNSQSGYHNIKICITYADYKTGTVNKLYSHCSVFRTGSSTVPSPTDYNPNSLLKSDPEKTDFYYYPEGTKTENKVAISKLICYDQCVPNLLCACCNKKTVCNYAVFNLNSTKYVGRKIEYQILFNPQNTSSKLRRPFVILDGFDPNNRRDYYQTFIEIDDDVLEKDRDKRGLFQILNGDPSPWYANSPDLNVIQMLKNEGFDIIFVNFLDGTGNIAANAEFFKGFLKDVLNGPRYRDNKTEEIVLVGPSMGGIISRLAITTMEKNNEEHFVRSWFSFDSPQKGANIPLGLQYAVNFLSKLDVPEIPFLKALSEGKSSFLSGKNTLDSYAARQMLINHYTETKYEGNPTPDFTQLYSILESNGYPKFSKNYAITNGGLGSLPVENHAEILKFQVILTPEISSQAFNNVNKDGLYQIFNGTLPNDKEIRESDGQISYDNAPGGWNSSLYSLNCNSANQYKKADCDIQYTRATFMVTASAFGIGINRGNVHYNWQKFTHCNDHTSGKIRTPFDVIHGAMGENEEHVRISDNTKTFIYNCLKEENENIVRPIFRYDDDRDREYYHQQVKGQSAFVAKKTITLGDNDNKFSIMSGADVTIQSGEVVILKPGFSSIGGSTVSISTGNVSGSTLKKGKIDEGYVSANYLESPSFLSEVYDYSKKTTENKEEKVLESTNIQPNPATDYIQFSSHKGSEFQIINSLGIVVYSCPKTQEEKTVINISKFSPGIYILKSSYNGDQKQFSFIKM